MADNKTYTIESVDDYRHITDRPYSLAADNGDLANQLSRCEEYADQLRWQIRNLQATVSTLSEQLSEAKDTSEHKGKLLDKLKSLLANARSTIAELRERNEIAGKRHRLEILALQVQLESADSSSDETDVQNLELASELLKVRESREALQRKMATHHTKAVRRINVLKAKCRELVRQKAEHKEQIDAKNKAIHALLNQLAPKTLPDNNDPGSDDTVQVIDYSLYGPLLDKSVDHTSPEREETPVTTSDFHRRGNL